MGISGQKGIVQLGKQFLSAEIETEPFSTLTSGNPIGEMEGEPSLTVEVEYDGKRYRGVLLPVKDEAQS